MRKVSVFNFVTLNGYFEGPKRDISWHKHGTEENEYAAENLKSGNTLLFGRVTYELMASYWPIRVGLFFFATGLLKRRKLILIASTSSTSAA